MSNEKKPVQSALYYCRSVLKYALIFGCICNLLLLSTTIYTMQVLDRVLSSGSLETLWMLTIITLIALVLLAAIQGGRVWLLSKVAQWFEQQISRSIFHSSVQDKNPGLIPLVNTLKGYMTSPGLIALLDLPWSILFIIVLFILHVYIGWVTVIGGLILILMGYLSHCYNQPLFKEQQKYARDSMRHVQQAQHNSDVLKSMGGLEDVEQDWQKVNDQAQQAQLALAKRQAMLSEMSKFFRLSLQISVTGFGAYLVLINEFTSGAIIASSALVGRALSPIEITLSSWRNLMAAVDAYKKLKALQDIPVDNNMTLNAPKGQLTLEKVYVSLNGMQNPILQNIHLKINAGDRLVVLGHNGAGKSTLAKVITGLWQPNIGSVSLDGHALSHWPKQQLTQSIGYIPQEITLFPVSIARNIARMANVIEDDKVSAAAQIAGADSWIQQLPEGYNTEMIPGMLSAGQRQQISIARAWYSQPKMIIMDEPHTALDQQGEQHLLRSLTFAQQEKITLVIISHHQSIIQLASHILLMQQGKMAAFGTKDDVLAKLSNNTGESVRQ